MYRSDSDELQAARAQLVSYSARLLDDGLAVGSAGNMSVRAGDLVAITPSGISYAEMRPDDVCLVSMDGSQLPDGAGGPETPSSETPMHLAIYAATSAAAVVHTHSPEVIALSASRPELPAIHYAITGLGGPVRVAPYVRFGSAGLAAAAVEALDGRSAVILRNHGAVTYGRDLAQAYDRALLLEWLARTYRLALCYGEPAILSAAELDEVTAETRRRRYGERARQPAHERGTTGALAAGPVTVLGAHILDVLGRPVEGDSARPGQRPAERDPGHGGGHRRWDRRRPGQAGRRVLAVGALGDDLLGDMVVAAMAGHGVDTGGLGRKRGVQTSATILPIRRNGERPALHVPGATSLLELADIDLDRITAEPGAAHRRAGRARPDRRRRAGAGDRRGRAGGALVAVDVLHPGRPRDLERLAGLLAAADWFVPNGDQLLALTGAP